MSDKPWEHLNIIDQTLRRAYPIGDGGGPILENNQPDVVIRKVQGFELFNTRPYHNYETWSDGYEATDGTYYAQAEDLDDCIRLLVERKKAQTGKTWERLHPNQRERFGLSSQTEVSS